MKSAIELLKAHRDICVTKSIAAANRHHMKTWEKWCDKANDAIEALFVLHGEKSAPKPQ